MTYLKINLRENPESLRFFTNSNLGDTPQEINDNFEKLKEEQNQHLQGIYYRGAEPSLLEDMPYMIARENGIRAAYQDQHFDDLSPEAKSQIFEQHLSAPNTPLLSLTISPEVAADWASRRAPGRDWYFIKPSVGSDYFLDPRTVPGSENHNKSEAEYFAKNMIPVNDIVAFCRFGIKDTITEIYISENLSQREKENILRCMFYGSPDPAKSPDFNPQIYLNQAISGLSYADTVPHTVRKPVQNIQDTPKEEVKASTKPKPNVQEAPATTEIAEGSVIQFRTALNLEILRLRGEKDSSPIMKNKLDSLENLQKQIKNVRDSTVLLNTINTWKTERLPSVSTSNYQNISESNYQNISKHRKWGLGKPTSQKNFDNFVQTLENSMPKPENTHQVESPKLGRNPFR